MRILPVYFNLLKNNNKSIQNKDLTSFGITSKKNENSTQQNPSFKGESMSWNVEPIYGGTCGVTNCYTVFKNESKTTKVHDCYRKDDKRNFYEALSSDQLNLKPFSIETIDEELKKRKVYFADPKEFIIEKIKEENDVIIHPECPSYLPLDVLKGYFSDHSSDCDKTKIIETPIKIGEFYHRLATTSLEHKEKLEQDKAVYQQKIERKNNLDELRRLMPWKASEETDNVDGIEEKLLACNQQIQYYDKNIKLAIEKQKEVESAYVIFKNAQDIVNERNKASVEYSTLSKKIARKKEYITSAGQEEIDSYNKKIEKENEEKEEPQKLVDSIDAILNLDSYINLKLTQEQKNKLNIERKSQIDIITEANRMIELYKADIEKTNEYIQCYKEEIPDDEKKLAELKKLRDKKEKEVWVQYERIKEFYEAHSLS